MTELEVKVDVLIPFHDADMMSVVWHGHYVKYFEIARCALLDEIDYNYLEMAESGYAWPVIDIRVKYIKPVGFGDMIKVYAKLAEHENRLKIKYLAKNAETGQTLVKGYTIQVAVDMETGEMCFASPDILLKKLGIQP